VSQANKTKHLTNEDHVPTQPHGPKSGWMDLDIVGVWRLEDHGTLGAKERRGWARPMPAGRDVEAGTPDHTVLNVRLI